MEDEKDDRKSETNTWMDKQSENKLTDGIGLCYKTLIIKKNGQRKIQSDQKIKKNINWNEEEKRKNWKHNRIQHWLLTTTQKH